MSHKSFNIIPSDDDEELKKLGFVSNDILLKKAKAEMKEAVREKTRLFGCSLGVT